MSAAAIRPGPNVLERYQSQRLYHLIEYQTSRKKCSTAVGVGSFPATASQIRVTKMDELDTMRLPSRLPSLIHRPAHGSAGPPGLTDEREIAP